MFLNNLKIALRIFFKTKLYGVINIVGLSIAIAFCLLTFLFINDEYSYDRFHENGDRIFALYKTDFKSDNVKNRPSPLDVSSNPDLVKSPSHSLSMLKLVEDRMPEIESLVRFGGWTTTIKKEGKSHSEVMRYVDQSLFDVFSFELIHGNKETALNELKNVVITEELALKYFGKSNVIGKILNLGTAKIEAYEITAIVKKPRHSSIEVNIFLPFENYYVYKSYRQDSWGYMATQAFLYLKEGVDKQEVAKKISNLYQERFVEEINKKRIELGLSEDNPVTQFDLINIQNLYLNPSLGTVKGSTPLYSFILGTVALLILVIAALNYVAISVSSANARSKEVIIRKVVGASRNQLKRQFYTESFLITLLSLIIGYTLMQLLLPMFNELSGKSIILTAQIQSAILLFGLMLWMLFAIMIGGYPAQILSRFKIANGLKGHATYKIKPWLIKGMVVFQFTICVFFISMGLTMNKQFQYMNDKDLGFDKDQVVIVDAKGVAEILTQKLTLEPSVSNVSKSIGFPTSVDLKVVFNGIEYRISSTAVGYDFFKTLGIEFVSGRPFDIQRDREFEKTKRVVNESYYKLISEDTLRNSHKDWVIGVVKDFHFESLNNKIRPMEFSLSDLKNFSKMIIKLRANNIREGLDVIESAWNEVAPDQIMGLIFLDDQLANNYKDSKKWGSIIDISAIIAMLIACSGLFGLTAINAMNQSKEIGIRKVLGANLSSLIILLNRPTLWLILLAQVIAIPLSYYFMEQWLNGFAYHTTIEYEQFLYSASICMFIVVLTVLYHSFKTSNISPKHLLRDD